MLQDWLEEVKRQKVQMAWQSQFGTRDVSELET